MFQHLEALTSSPFFIGVMLLLLNVGSKYITHEFSKSDEEFNQNMLLRRLAIFAVCFIGTKNLIVSILLTAGFVTLASGFFRQQEGFEEEITEDERMRLEAGLRPKIDQPGYDKEIRPLFTK